MTKSEVLNGISCALSSPEMLLGNKLILLTSAGLIAADFVFSNDQEYEKTGIFRALMKGIYCGVNNLPITSLKSDSNDESTIIGDEESIMLKNVTLISAGNPSITISSMILYYEDIIGISIGKLG